MRFIEVVPHVGNEASGPTYSVVELSRSLAEAGHQVVLMSVKDGLLPDHGTLSHRVFPKTRWPAAVWRSPKLANALDAEVPACDVVHTHGMWVMPAVYPGWSASAAAKPLVISPRGSLSPVALRRSRVRKALFWQAFHRSSFGYCGCFHATSAAEYRDIRAFGLRAPVAIIPNGIRVPSVGVDTPAKRRRVLFLGRIHPIKGLNKLLSAWAAVSSVHDRWELHLVGPDDGGHRAELERVVRRNSLPRVVFRGPVFGDDKWREYQAASVYVLPSESENFGMTVAESLASGTPAIVTVNAPWAGLATKRCGWSVAGTSEALATALNEALSLPEHELRAMGRRGQKWMAKDFDWRAIAQRMAEVYAWLRRGGPPPETVQLA